MSGQQTNAWQRPRPSNSASRTPQSRSGNASPSQQGNLSQPPPGRTSQPATGNVWSERSRSASGAPAGSNGRQVDSVNANIVAGDEHVPVNGFNTSEVKEMLNRESRGSAYKVVENGTGRTGGAWASKVNHMANNQPFFVQLSKQIAALETSKGG